MHINVQELLSFLIFLVIAYVIVRRKLFPILDQYIKDIMLSINSLHAKEKVSKAALESAISEHSEAFMYSERLSSIANNKMEEIKLSFDGESERIKKEFDQMLKQYENNLRKKEKMEYITKLFNAVNSKMMEIDGIPKINNKSLRGFVEKVRSEHERINKKF